MVPDLGTVGTEEVGGDVDRVVVIVPTRRGVGRETTIPTPVFYWGIDLQTRTLATVPSRFS
jgi:hypothetical protein